jgi:GT2 family glycosyltransferase
MNIKVSVIIVNYNCEEHTCNCISSIYKNITDPYYEIIVVDNASSITSINTISEQFPEIKLILNQENKGFGTANNIGARHALGKYLFFLNPDTLLLNDSISQFYQFLENTTSDVACCGGNLVTAEQVPTTSHGNFPSVLQQFSDIGFRTLYKKFYAERLTMGKPCDFKDIRQIDYLVGAAFFIKKQLFDMIGGFDEAFFMYYEETDLFFRLNKAGYKAYILPYVKIIHLEGVTEKSNEAFNYEKWAMMEKSRYYYFTKNRGRFSSLCVRFVQMLSLTLLYCFGSTKVNLRRAIRITLSA